MPTLTLPSVFALIAHAAFAATIELEQDVYVREPGKSEKTLYNAGQSFNYDKNLPLLLEAPGRVSVILLPTDPSESSSIRLNQPLIDEWPAPKVQKAIDRSLSKIMESAFQIQNLLAQKKLDAAATELTQLQSEYPDVTYLNFLRASIELMRGNTETASIAIKKALAAHPNNEEGKRLAEILAKGGRR